MKNTLKIISVLSIIFTIFAVIYIWWLFSFYNLGKMNYIEVVAGDKSKYLEYYENRYDAENGSYYIDGIDRVAIKDFIYKDLNVKYKVTEKDLPKDIAGYSHILTQQIEIDQNISNDMFYVITLVHEIMHLHKHRANEMRTQWNTYNYLKDSENKVLNICADEMAIRCFANLYPKEYDLSYWIIKGKE